MATNTLTNVNQRLLAKELNVSVGTVSKALRDYPDVGVKTKTKVVELAKKLGYRAYLSDFQYEDVRSEVKFVGVLTQTPQRNYTQIDYLHGMSEISSELNVSQFVHNYTADKCGDILIPSLQPPVMREGLMSGLIFIHRWPRNIVQALSEKYHCVSIVHDYTDLGVSYVGLDNSGAISMLFDHLYRLGHRNIGFLGRCKELTWSMARFGGYCQSMAVYGLNIESENVFDVDVRIMEDKRYDWEKHYDFDAIAERIEQGVTAFICSADICAYNLFEAMKNRGYSIPDDLSITGFDISGDTTFGLPPVTSVVVDSPLLGRRALRLLIDIVGNVETGCSKVVHKCEFFEGATLASPRLLSAVC